MGTITTTDGTEISYKDSGTGQPVVFSHGWPLTADVWDDQLFLVACNGYRAIADRRGGGRSGQPWNGNDLDTYADDLAVLIETPDLHDVVLVGHSTGEPRLAQRRGREWRNRGVSRGGRSLPGPVTMDRGWRPDEGPHLPPAVVRLAEHHHEGD